MSFERFLDQVAGWVMIMGATLILLPFLLLSWVFGHEWNIEVKDDGA